MKWRIKYSKDRVDPIQLHTEHGGMFALETSVVEIEAHTADVIDNGTLILRENSLQTKAAFSAGVWHHIQRIT